MKYKNIIIDGFKIEDDFSTFIIVKIGVNHNSRIITAKKLVDLAKTTRVYA